MNGLDSTFRKNLISFWCPGYSESGSHVAPGSLEVQRWDMVAHAYTLEKWKALRFAQFFIKLRLTNKKDIDEFLVTRFHV